MSVAAAIEPRTSVLSNMMSFLEVSLNKAAQIFLVLGLNRAVTRSWPRHWASIVSFGGVASRRRKLTGGAACQMIEGERRPKRGSAFCHGPSLQPAGNGCAGAGLHLQAARGMVRAVSQGLMRRR